MPRATPWRHTRYRAGSARLGTIRRGYAKTAVCFVTRAYLWACIADCWPRRATLVWAWTTSLTDGSL